jgi:hypothetical protein
VRRQQVIFKLVHLRFLICEGHFEQIFLRGNGLFTDCGLRKVLLFGGNVRLQLSDLVLAEVNLTLQLVQLVFYLVLHLWEVRECRGDLLLSARSRLV